VTSHEAAPETLRQLGCHDFVSSLIEADLPSRATTVLSGMAMDCPQSIL
jgi:hypothetical protein